MKVFITGIGTEVGKTMVSAVLCQAFGADYWKPVQAGNADATDTMLVRKLVTNPNCFFHPEVYVFRLAASPHRAAADENKVIEMRHFGFLQSANHVVIEGAGGLLVPLTRHLLIADLITFLKTPVILVSKNYLGSINHTLLTIEALRARSIPLLGVVFNGNEDLSSESAILEFGKTRFLGRVKQEPVIDRAAIRKYAEEFRKSMGNIFR